MPLVKSPRNAAVVAASIALVRPEVGPVASNPTVHQKPSPNVMSLSSTAQPGGRPEPDGCALRGRPVAENQIMVLSLPIGLHTPDSSVKPIRSPTGKDHFLHEVSRP